ncbi:MAG: hypothetical protein ACR2P0_19430 [Acidimicrobiales bacterium]
MSMRYIRAVFVVLALIGASCGGDDEVESSTDTAAVADDATTTAAPAETTTTEAPDFDGDSGGDFCTLAREFEENDPLANSSILDGAQFFDDVEALYSEVLPASPDEIRPDFELTRDTMREMRSILESVNYNMLDASIEADLEAIDTSGLDAADARISAYLLDVCGIERAVGPATDGAIPLPDPADFEDLDPAAADGILEALGISPELAECLNEELGGDFDFENLDPTTMTTEICGTTFLEILTGIGGG